MRTLLALLLTVLSLFGAGTASAQEAPTPKNTATAAVNGIDLYYAEYGEGPPLVLLHGFSASGGVWRQFIPAFAAKYRVIVPDMRGHGRSTNPSNQFTHKQSALDIYALLDKLGIREFSALGISSGGMTLLHMATQQPARVKNIALIGATTYFPAQAREIMRRTTFEGMSPQQLEDARKIHVRGDEQIKALRQQFHAFKDSYEDMAFTPPLLATITARTLVVHGDRDAFFPVEIPLEMYRSIPRAYLWIIPNGGHVPIYGPNVRFAEVCLEFLGGGR